MSIKIELRDEIDHDYLVEILEDVGVLFDEIVNLMNEYEELEPDVSAALDYIEEGIGALRGNI